MATKSDWFEKAAADMESEAEELKVEAEAPDWEPEEGDVLEAVFLKAVPKATQYGIGYQLIVKNLLDDEKVTKVWAQRKTLKEGVISAAPAQGSLFMVHYVGQMQATGSGRNFHMYQVRCEKSDADYWLRIQQEGWAKQKEFDENKGNIPEPDDDALEAPF